MHRNQNGLKTALLLGLLSAIIIAISGLFGRGALVIGLVIALGINAFAYFNSDKLARECGIGREAQDAYALRSHQRGNQASLNGRFADSKQQAQQQNLAKCLGKTDGRRSQRPKQKRYSVRPFQAEPVHQIAGGDLQQRVRPEECRKQRSHPACGRAEFPHDRDGDDAQVPAIDVVYQDGEEQQADDHPPAGEGRRRSARNIPYVAAGAHTALPGSSNFLTS